jgi:hypothetical protein
MMAIVVDNQSLLSKVRLQRIVSVWQGRKLNVLHTKHQQSSRASRGVTNHFPQNECIQNPTGKISKTFQKLQIKRKRKTYNRVEGHGFARGRGPTRRKTTQILCESMESIDRAFPFFSVRHKSLLRCVGVLHFHRVVTLFTVF